MAEDATEPAETAEEAEPLEERAEEARAEPAPEPAPAPAPVALPSRRGAVIAAASVGLLGLIALDVRYIARATHGSAPALAASASVAEAPSAAPTPSEDEAAAEDEGETAPVPSSSAGELFQDDEEPPTAVEPKKPKRDEHALRGTVRDAAARSCSTSSVDGLSRQIIGQSRCIDPRAFVPVPRQPNLETGRSVFLYMDASARDHLVRALQSNKRANMTVNSALRTVAQQYLLRRWALGKRCGIEIATPPGESNHETGLALDIAQAPAWRAALEAQDFKWLGSIDRVHFDYKGPNASSRASVDVKAFQQLWNLNHADDLIVENGQYSPATEDRLEKSPARGFPTGPRCKH